MFYWSTTDVNRIPNIYNTHVHAHMLCVHSHPLHCVCETAHIFYMPTLGITRYRANVGASGQTIPYPGEGPREEEEV